MAEGITLILTETEAYPAISKVLYFELLHSSIWHCFKAVRQESSDQAESPDRKFSLRETKPGCGLQSKGKQCEGTGSMCELRKPQAEVTKIIPNTQTKIYRA